MEVMSAIGMPKISRKQPANRWIPKLAEEANVATVATLEKALLVGASSDGWRNKYCEQGASLSSIVALLQERLYFHDPVNCSSMREDAESIANFLTTAAQSIVGSTDEDLERLVGWVLDNTKANWWAMRKLEKVHPKRIMCGCFAHSVAPLTKDLCKFKPATGRGAATRSFSMKCAESCVDDGNKIANFLQDSGAARQVVDQKQKEVMHGRRPTIHVNVPSRWSMNYLVLNSILHSRTALKLAAASDALGQLSSGSQARNVRNLLLDGEFWQNVEMLVELLHSFSDAIHQLEGDKPHLAECHQALVVLCKHFEDWAKKNMNGGLAEDEACPVTGRALAIMDRRLDASPGGSVATVYSATYSAAFAVDAFFADGEETSHGVFCCASVLDYGHMHAAESLIGRVGGRTAATEFACLSTQGYPKRMQSVDAGLALQRQQDATGCNANRPFSRPVRLGSTCTRQEVPPAVDRIRVWRKFGDSMRELQAVAVRLLSTHATSAATERNWSLRGRMYRAACSSLGMQRAKALIAICASENSKLDPTQEFETILSVLEVGE
jgi:hypothetical protein